MTFLDRERRLNFQLHQYWDELRQGRMFPSEDDIDPDLLEGIWDDCFLLQARDVEVTADYNYTYLGTNIIRAYQSHVIPGPLEGLVYTEASHLASQFRQVFSSKQPLITDAAHHVGGQGVLRYRQILLPLGKSAERVEVVMGRMGCRLYPDH